MMKRLTWFVSGAAAGIAGAGYTKRKVKATAAQLAPNNVARTATAKVRGRSHDLAEAVREGRAAMKAKEAELRAKLPGGAGSLADELHPDDQVLVDGYPVEAGQVIVVRQVRDTETTVARRRSRRSRRGA